METRSELFTFRDVVLIADRFAPSSSDDHAHARRDLEKTDISTLEVLRRSITALGLRVHHYQGPDELARFADRHKQDLVFTVYGGQRSRNRMALVPAICETFGLKFIGPDVYGRVVAQDKEISKRLALECGLSTPAWRIVRKEADLDRAFGVDFPVVVKPLLEGSSIGIAQENRCSSVQDAKLIARELLSRLSQPILVETFVPGREVAYSKIDIAQRNVWTFSEVFIEGQPQFFEQRLFDAHEKLFRTEGRSVRNIDSELNETDRMHIDSFLDAFGKYGYCRVDGRLAEGRFHFLEFTPDAWLGPRGQFAMSFTESGWTYTSIIEAVLASAN